MKRFLFFLIFALVLIFGCIPSQNKKVDVVIKITGVNEENPSVKPLLGVISGPDPCPGNNIVPNLTPHYKDIGVISIRNQDYYDDRLDIEGIFNCGGDTYPSWEGCDPEDDSNYNWGPSDKQFESYINGGFEPFLRLGGEFQNQLRHHDFKGPQNEIQERNWIIAATKVVERYNNWKGMKNVLNYIDIWTEFPNKLFYDRDILSFYKFWAKAYVKIKSEFPQLKVGGPGFVGGTTMKVIDGTDKVAKGFLSYLYNHNIKIDWLGFHIFSNDPDDYKKAGEAFRDLLDGEGKYKDVDWAGTGFFKDTELIVDAYMESTINVSKEEARELRNGKKGAAIMTGAWISMQDTDIKMAYYYRGNDPNPPSDNHISSGLFYGDEKGTYKPKAYAFKLWSTMANEFPNRLKVEFNSEDLKILSSRSRDGKRIAFLISNISEKNITIAFDIPEKHGEIFIVNDKKFGEEEEFFGKILNLEGYNVALIVFTE